MILFNDDSENTSHYNSRTMIRQITTRGINDDSLLVALK